MNAEPRTGSAGLVVTAVVKPSGDGGSAGTAPARGAVAVRNRGQRTIRIELLEGVEQGTRPRASGLGSAEVTLRRRRLRPDLLPEHVVHELATPVLLNALRADGSELHERIAGELAHARFRHAEHPGELLVRLSLLEDKLNDRALLSGELIEGGHRNREL